MDENMKNWLQTEIRSQTGAFTLTWLDSLNRGPDSPLLLARRPRLLDVLEVLNVQMNEIKKIELFFLQNSFKILQNSFKK